MSAGCDIFFTLRFSEINLISVSLVFSEVAFLCAPRFSSRMIRLNPNRRPASDIAETKMLLARIG